MAESDDKPSLPSAVVRAGLSAIPVVGGPVAELWDYAQELDRWRVRQMGEEARSMFGNDDEFVRRIRADERLLDMLVEAADAARRTSLEAKRVAMGRVLAHAMTDDAEIDDSASILTALANLEAPHFRILAQLSLQPRIQIGPENEVPEPYLSQLVAEGLVHLTEGLINPSATTVAGSIYVTSFGHDLLRWIREAGG